MANPHFTARFQSFENGGTAGAAGQRLEALRALMAADGLDGVLVPRADRHQGEYVAACDDRLSWISGFTGSAGLLLATREAATDAKGAAGALFVDSRYTVQAAGQTAGLGLDIVQVPDTEPLDWARDALAHGARIGFDPLLHASGEIQRLLSAGSDLSPDDIAPDPAGNWATPDGHLHIVPLDLNPIDRIWSDRPPAPNARLRVQPDDLAGQSAAEKLAAIQADLIEAGVDAHLTNLPDTVSWLLNLRGDDVPHVPVARYFALVPADGLVTLFIGDGHGDNESAPDQPDDVLAALSPVARMLPVAQLKAQMALLAGKRVQIAKATAPVAFTTWLEAAGAKPIAAKTDPIVARRAVKTSAECDGARAAHIRDGAAMVKFLHWLDQRTTSMAADPLHETEIVAALETFRREVGEATGHALRDISFDTICGSGPNGAIVHYRVTQATDRKLEPGDLLLIDSGGQYADGTTDVTRTVFIPGPDAPADTPTPAMRHAYTRVLQGHIALSMALFPQGARGVDIDAIARRPLWASGLDYGHGTGHGVGSYLSVHEGPASISKRGMVALEAGMILSNEPGYYWEGHWGIRIENLVLVRAADDEAMAARRASGDLPEPAAAMLGFETLTRAPYDPRLIDHALLSTEERNWLAGYHDRVVADLAPLLDDSERAWLRAQWH